MYAPGAASADTIQSKEFKKKFPRLGLSGAAVLVVGEHTSKIAKSASSCTCYTVKNGKNNPPSISDSFLKVFLRVWRRSQSAGVGRGHISESDQKRTSDPLWFSLQAQRQPAKGWLIWLGRCVSAQRNKVNETRRARGPLSPSSSTPVLTPTHL